MKRLLLMMVLLSSAYYVSAAQTVEEYKKISAAQKAAAMQTKRKLNPLKMRSLRPDEVNAKAGISYYTTGADILFLQGKHEPNPEEFVDMLSGKIDTILEEAKQFRAAYETFKKNCSNTFNMYNTLLSMGIIFPGKIDLNEEQLQKAYDDLSRLTKGLYNLNDENIKLLFEVFEGNITDLQRDISKKGGAEEPQVERTLSADEIQAQQEAEDARIEKANRSLLGLDEKEENLRRMELASQTIPPKWTKSEDGGFLFEIDLDSEDEDNSSELDSLEYSND